MHFIPSYFLFQEVDRASMHVSYSPPLKKMHISIVVPHEQEYFVRSIKHDT